MCITALDQQTPTQYPPFTHTHTHTLKRTNWKGQISFSESCQMFQASHSSNYILSSFSFPVSFLVPFPPFSHSSGLLFIFSPFFFIEPPLPLPSFCSSSIGFKNLIIYSLSIWSPLWRLHPPLWDFCAPSSLPLLSFLSSASSPLFSPFLPPSLYCQCTSTFCSSAAHSLSAQSAQNSVFSAIEDIFTFNYFLIVLGLTDVSMFFYDLHPSCSTSPC